MPEYSNPATNISTAAWTTPVASHRPLAQSLQADELMISSVRLEEILNLVPFMFLAINGSIPFISDPTPVEFQGWHIIFWTITCWMFYRTNFRLHLDLWTCRFGLAFLLFGLASGFWGTATLKAFIRPSIDSVCVFLYYNYLMSRFKRVQFVRMLVWALTILMVLSIIAAVAFPMVGVDQGTRNHEIAGSWQGVFSQKNNLGIGCAVGVAVALGLKPQTNADRTWRWLLMVLALFCVYKSGSRESWIAIGIILMLVPILAFIRRFDQRSRLPLIIIVGVIGTITTALIYTNLDAFLALFGRTRNLTNRTDIWAAVWLLIGRRPLLGYGTYGVWGTPVAYDADVRVGGWEVSSSHNDFLEIILTYGFIGFALYLPIIISAIFYIGRAVLSYTLAHLEVLIYCMIVVLVESFAAAVIMYTPAIGMILVLYCTSQLELIERTGFMRLDPSTRS
ncbi:O-antigen ligase [Bryocella elongata]|uniref:O-antigen ligase n=1 Tax=Bryocella elongata TaxID=863522 RepID=A0A1H5UCV1_9BACT|nr:O-antigen ligase family protein [Bryocella elongata]SEF72824.1 O-antigen ligase [Bryocella elongata]